MHILQTIILTTKDVSSGQFEPSVMVKRYFVAWALGSQFVYYNQTPCWLYGQTTPYCTALHSSFTDKLVASMVLAKIVTEQTFATPSPCKLQLLSRPNSWQLQSSRSLTSTLMKLNWQAIFKAMEIRHFVRRRHCKEPLTVRLLRSPRVLEDLGKMHVGTTLN